MWGISTTAPRCEEAACQENQPECRGSDPREEEAEEEEEEGGGGDERWLGGQTAIFWLPQQAMCAAGSPCQEQSPVSNCNVRSLSARGEWLRTASSPSGIGRRTAARGGCVWRSVQKHRRALLSERLATAALATTPSASRQPRSAGVEAWASRAGLSRRHMDTAPSIWRKLSTIQQGVWFANPVNVSLNVRDCPPAGCDHSFREVSNLDAIRRRQI